MIVETPGTCDQDIGAAAQIVELTRHRIATDDQGGFQPRVACKDAELLGDLRRELAGRHQHHRADPGRLWLWVRMRTIVMGAIVITIVMGGGLMMAAGMFSVQLVDERYQVRGGLAAAGFGGRDQVAARHRNRNRAGLNGGGLMVAAVFD